MNKSRVCGLVERNRGETVRVLQEITKFPSMMGREQGAQDCYAGLLRDMGLTVDVWQPRPEDMAINPFFLPARDNYEGSPNVVGTLKGAGGGRSIILNGHVDVVPEGDNDWAEDPWGGVYKDGKVFGRGVADMKGGLIANLMAVKAIVDAGIRLKGDVIAASVIGEETGGAGTLSLLSRGYTADAAIIPEPTDLRICPVTPGVMWFRITVRGLATHAGTAHLGVNAISKAAAIIQAVDAYDHERRTRPRHELYKDKPHPFNVNMGVIRGGVFPTSVPDEVVLEGRIAISPHEDMAAVRREVEDVVRGAAARDAWLKQHVPEVEWYGFCLVSGLVSMDHPFTATLTRNYRDAMGAEPVISGTPWGTDAGAMIRYGHVPTIVFGPGPGDTAHKADEFVDVDKLIAVTKVIASTILDWCGEAD